MFIKLIQSSDIQKKVFCITLTHHNLHTFTLKQESLNHHKILYKLHVSTNLRLAFSKFNYNSTRYA